MEMQTQGTLPDARIQKSIVLRTPRSRVWRAIADSKEFGAWFGMDIEGSFAPGSRLTGTITPTTVDPEVAKQQQQYEGLAGELVIERVEPERLLSFRWHPFAVEGDIDYSGEPTTLVAFELEEKPHGTELTVTETGFERLPAERRAKAFAANDQGWAKQMELISKYLAKS